MCFYPSMDYGFMQLKVPQTWPLTLINACYDHSQFSDIIKCILIIYIVKLWILQQTNYMTNYHQMFKS